MPRLNKNNHRRIGIILLTSVLIIFMFLIFYALGVALSDNSGASDDLYRSKAVNYKIKHDAFLVCQNTARLNMGMHSGGTKIKINS